ncbi:MAG: hypothetical protein CUN52_00090 [Phototrophicales bacterium]|nr:MAG: hypothetical protein CUN52_00090 [Phototrophicales bacterium]
MFLRDGRWRILLMIGVVVLMNTFVAGAAERDRASWTVTCDGFRSNGGGFVLTRDNTGIGREELVIYATDGTGKIIFGPVAESFIIGGGLYITDGVSFRWTTAPTANPLTVYVVSSAGNGLPQQPVYSVQGTCDNFPAFLTPLPFPPIQPPSPSVAINQSSPLVANPQNIGRDYEGYLIVNTFRANLRSGDGVRYTIVARVNGGTELIVLGVNEARTWWFVEVDETRGWINGDLVLVRGNLNNVPILSPEEAQGEILPPRFFLWITTPLRATPSERGATICQLPGNLEYVILGRTGDSSWYLVQAVCGDVLVEGWFKADAGAIRNLGRLPIPVIP